MTLATIIIDMQKAFTKDVNSDRLDALIHSQKEIINYSVAKEIPIYNIEMNGYSGIISELADLIPDIEKNTFRKNRCDAFNNNFLRKELRSKNIRDVFLMGLLANACVYSSAITASKKFKVHVADTTMASGDRVIQFYPDVASRKKSFLSVPIYDGKPFGKKNNIFYHNSHNDFIDYVSTKKITREVEC
jgi:nicotinamidase-related amidase